MGRLLAIDYGTRRVGLALSDPLKMIASPYRTIINKGNITPALWCDVRPDVTGRVSVPAYPGCG